MSPNQRLNSGFSLRPFQIAAVVTLTTFACKQRDFNSSETLSAPGKKPTQCFYNESLSQMLCLVGNIQTENGGFAQLHSSSAPPRQFRWSRAAPDTLTFEESLPNKTFKKCSAGVQVASDASTLISPENADCMPKGYLAGDHQGNVLKLTKDSLLWIVDGEPRARMACKESTFGGEKKVDCSQNQFSFSGHFSKNTPRYHLIDEPGEPPIEFSCYQTTQGVQGLLAFCQEKSEGR